MCPGGDSGGMNQDRVIESYYPDGSLVTAEAVRRLGAFLLDVVIFWFTLSIGWIIWFIIVAPNGQTPGKQILGMYVMKADGSRAGGGDVWMRELLLKFLVIWILSVLTSGIFPLIAALWCLWDRNVQCLWDKMGGTYVAWSPRGYRPLTAPQLRATGQVLHRYPSYQQQQPQAYPGPSNPPPMQPPFGQPFEAPVESPFAMPSAPNAADAPVAPAAPVSPPAVEPSAAPGTPPLPGAGYAQPADSPFREHATSLATPPASADATQGPQTNFAQPVSSPFAQPIEAADLPIDGVPGPEHGSPFAQPAEWPDPAGTPAANQDAPSPFDFSDDPTFEQDSFVPSVPPASEPGGSVANRLGELVKVWEQGLLTEEEYQSRRQAILDEL